MNSAFARHSGLPFVPHPAPDELLGSWLLRVAQFYGLGLTTLLNRLDARPSSNARVEHWFTLGGACLSLDALSSASHLSRTYLAAMAPSACSPRWPKELGACAQCLTHKAQSGNAITWNRDWMSPLATMCSTHGTSLTPVATRTLAGIRHAGDFGVLVQQLSAQQRPEDKPTGASDALWLQDMCTARTAARPPWGRTRPHDLIRIVDVIAREEMAQSDSDSSDLGLPPDRQHGSVTSFTFVLRNGALVGISLPTQLRQRQRVMARVAHVLRLPCEERACCSPWSAASIKRLAWMHNWPDGALAWICPPAAKLVRHQEALQRQFSISPKYFKAYAALLASIR